MTPSEIQLDLLITDKEADAEQLDDLTVRLMRDLRELGAESVERLAGEEVPEGAKGDSFTIGALALVAVPAVLPSLVNFLQAWSLRGDSRRVKIKTASGVEIEFTPEKKLSRQDLLELVAELSANTEAADAVPESSPTTLSYRTQLRQLLSSRFSEGELQTFCFDLGVDYETLPGEGKADKARELVEYLERHSRIQECVELGKQLRPDVPWERLPDAT
jgi:hypothetical protein